MGPGNGTVQVRRRTSSAATAGTWGGTNTLVSDIFKFDAHAAAGDSLTGLRVFTLGTGAQQFDFDVSFVPANSIFNGNAPTDTIFLRIDEPSYNASGWNIAN